MANTQTEDHKDEFRYLDIRYSSGSSHSVIVIYENLTNNPEIDKKTTTEFLDNV